MPGKTKRNIVLSLLALAFLGFLASLVFSKRGEAGVPVVTERIAIRDFSTTVSASGQAEAADAAHVRANIAGQVAEVLVESGQEVKSGQILARLDDRQALLALRQAEQSLALAQAELDALSKANEERAVLRRQEKARAERNAASAERSLARAQDRYDRTKALYAEGVVSEQQLEEAADALRLAKENAAEAAAVLADLNATPGLEDTRLAETRVREAEKALVNARADLEMNVFKSPQDGIVLFRAVEPGMAVVPGATLFVIGTTGKLKVKAMIDEAYIVNIQAGQEVKVTHDALPGLDLAGRVTAIAPQGLMQEKISLFEVEIEFANRDGAIRPGMTVDCEIRTATAQQVPIVPLLAVFDEQDGDRTRKYVYLVDEGKAMKTYLELGLTGEAEAEVRQGLRGGETLIVGEIDTLRALRDGQAVRSKRTEQGK